MSCTDGGCSCSNEERDDNLVVITRIEYKRLLKSDKMLDALVGAGVDCWEGYDYAMESLSEEE